MWRLEAESLPQGGSWFRAPLGPHLVHSQVASGCVGWGEHRRMGGDGGKAAGRGWHSRHSSRSGPAKPPRSPQDSFPTEACTWVCCLPKCLSYSARQSIGLTGFCEVFHSASCQKLPLPPCTPCCVWPLSIPCFSPPWCVYHLPVSAV